MKNVVTGMMLASGIALAGESELINPGVAALRDLAADRPDATESPITVDKGHWQVETSVVDYAKDFQFEAWTWGETNLKYGITENADIQFVFAPYAEERVRDSGSTETTDGASDLTIRLKYNLWGNDGGKSAMAFFPFVKVPTGTDLSNDKWEGGLILPYAYEINDRVGFGAQVELGYNWDDEDEDYDVELSHTFVVGYSLTDKWGVYGEYLGVAGDHSYEAYASGGITYAVTEFFQLDAGSVVGLNDAAQDFNVFSGFTVKF